MSKEYSDNFLLRGAQGWTDWVREIVSFGQYGRTPQSAGPKRPAPSRSLKTSLKPANKAKLTRDLQQHRRPAPKDESAQEMVQLRRTNPVIKDFKKKRRGRSWSAGETPPPDPSTLTSST